MRDDDEAGHVEQRGRAFTTVTNHQGSPSRAVFDNRKSGEAPGLIGGPTNPVRSRHEPSVHREEPDIREEVTELVARRPMNVHLDFVDVTFMDCAGIGVLMELRQLLDAHGHQLRLLHVGDQARRPIDVLGLSGYLHVVEPNTSTMNAMQPSLIRFANGETPIADGSPLTPTADVGSPK